MIFKLNAVHQSEQQTHRKLNVAWATASQKRVADAHIGRNGDWEKALAASG